MSCFRFTIRLAALLATILPAACDDSGASGPVAPGEDYGPRVIATCSGTTRSIDCECFWNEARAAFNKENLTPILQALAEREHWGAAITRARLEKVAGKKNYRVISGALYECVKLR